MPKTPPLEKTDRSSLEGFKKYWSERPNYFREVYHHAFAPDTFSDAMSIDWSVIDQEALHG